MILFRKGDLRFGDVPFRQLVIEQIFHMNRVFPILLFSSTLSFFACNNKKDKVYSANPEAIYFEYQITGRESDDKLTVNW